MLLRVDVYPHTANAATAVSSELPPPLQSLTVSLNTSTSGTGATILTVGRKDADVILQGDKSVSRQHMSLELVSSEEFSPVEGKLAPRAPEGSVETEACESGGTVVVLKDSSRFGTFVITDSGNQEVPKVAVDDDSATGDDSTDDEGQAAVAAASQQASSQLSSIATKLVNPTSARSDKVIGPTVLTGISTPNGRAIIQCGQNGSTLVVQRIHIRVVLSRTSKATKELWASRCPILGVIILETVDASTTHLVTADRITNAKSLVAWFLKKPMVTFDYLEALWNRTSARDVLPDVADFVPTPGDKEAFWDQTPNRGLWSHCTMLSFSGKDDMEAICRAAGATVVELYNAEGDVIQAADDAMKKHNGCFFINSSTRMHAKLVKHLKKNNVPPLSQKSLALFISQQEPLKDSHGDFIGMPREEQCDDENTDEETEDNPAKGQPATKAIEEMKEVPKEIRKSQSPGSGKKATAESSPEDLEVQERSALGETQLESNETEPLEQPSTSRKSRRRSSQDDETQERLEKPAMSRSSRKRREVEKDDAVSLEENNNKPAIKKKKRSLGGWTDVRKQSQDSKEKKSTEEGADEDGKIPPNDDGDDDDEREESDNTPATEEEHYGTRKRLPRTNDGWLVAAPADRKEFKATEAELLDTLGDDATVLPPTAETDIIKGMAVAAKGQASREEAYNTTEGGVKNFKRFRKNPVIRAGDVSRIQMRMVLPKQSDKQMELQDEQAQLEASLREADALFREEGMRSHFKPRGNRARKV